MNNSLRDFLSFVDTVKKAAHQINSSDDIIYILSHIDADGITCAGIIAKLLYLLDKPFILKFTNTININFLTSFYERADPRNIIFCDLGSGHLNMISETLKKAESVIILDHHVPVENLDTFEKNSPFRLIHVNPRIYGYNGGYEVSSSSVSYFIAHVFSRKIGEIVDLTKYAIIGALGDSQDVGDKKSLIGLNALIVNEAKKNGVIEEKIDLLILGRKSKPLYQALAETYSPILPGITGSLEGALKFIANIGLSTGRLDMENITLEDLNENQKALLLEKLVERISIAFGDKMSIEEIKNMLIGYTYLIKNEEKPMLMDAREFSTLLNACGKLGQPSIGAAMLIGDKNMFYDKVVTLYKRYRYSISEAVKRARENIRSFGKIKVIDGDNWLEENLTSTVASIMSQNILDGDILVVFSKEINGAVKVSLRKLRNSKVKNILNLMKQALLKLGRGEGGGHEEAAGAYIPLEAKEKFISILRDIAV